MRRAKRTLKDHFYCHNQSHSLHSKQIAFGNMKLGHSKTQSVSQSIRIDRHYYGNTQTELTCPLTTTQQSFSLLCLATSASVYSFSSREVGAAGVAEATTEKKTPILHKNRRIEQHAIIHHAEIDNAKVWIKYLQKLKQHRQRVEQKEQNQWLDPMSLGTTASDLQDQLSPSSMKTKTNEQATEA